MVFNVSFLYVICFSEECEKLKLCKLHLRANHNFIAAFELYFVKWVNEPFNIILSFFMNIQMIVVFIFSKENARLWDHRARSSADCERKYGDCYRK